MCAFLPYACMRIPATATACLPLYTSFTKHVAQSHDIWICTCVLFLGFYMRVLLRVQVIHTYILIQMAKSVTFHTCDILCIPSTLIGANSFVGIHVCTYILIYMFIYVCLFALITCASSCGYIWKEFPRVQPHVCTFIHHISLYISHIYIACHCACCLSRHLDTWEGDSEQYEREREREEEDKEGQHKQQMHFIMPYSIYPPYTHAIYMTYPSKYQHVNTYTTTYNLIQYS